MEALVAIISARRPNSVEKMSKFAPNARWYVAEGETEAYKSAGAVDVVEAGGLIAARNQAIEDAHTLLYQQVEELYSLQKHR